MSKKLVAYFSASGVTTGVAKALAEAVGADIYEIKPWDRGNAPCERCGAWTVGFDVNAAGQIYRLHFALDVFSLASHEYKVTEEKTGESLTNFTVNQGDLFIGDRI